MCVCTWHVTQGLQRSKLLLHSLSKTGQNCPLNKRTLMSWTQGARSSDTANCFPEIILDAEKQRIYSRHSSMINESQYHSRNMCKWQKLKWKKTHQCVLFPERKKSFFPVLCPICWHKHWQTGRNPVIIFPFILKKSWVRG